MRRYDHVDLRVRDLNEARAFYEALLPALGFTLEVKIEDWLQFERMEEGGIGEFFGVTESSGHVANKSRIAFWAYSPGEVDELARVAVSAGARSVEGPAYEAPNYYAIFFEDPSGNCLEICHRT
jgi:catechol 2,3-dioxygenase-like lactoylglutathione lyase family enzyme